MPTSSAASEPCWSFKLHYPTPGVRVSLSCSPNGWTLQAGDVFVNHSDLDQLHAWLCRAAYTLYEMRRHDD